MKERRKLSPEEWEALSEAMNIGPLELIRDVDETEARHTQLSVMASMAMQALIVRGPGAYDTAAGVADTAVSYAKALQARLEKERT